jgi:hypothetical protein
VFVATFLVASLVWCVLLYKRDPGLLQERLKGIYQPGQSVWDKAFLTAVAVAWFAVLRFIGCDAKRFHGSHMPMLFAIPLMLGFWGSAGGFRSGVPFDGPHSAGGTGAAAGAGGL